MVVLPNIRISSGYGAAWFKETGFRSWRLAIGDTQVFKAVVAIAPVTDLNALKEEYRHWSNFSLVADFVSTGPLVDDGSPINHTDKIRAPVMLFHGGLDRNVSVSRALILADRLTKDGVRNEIVIWGNLDHYLGDAGARTESLRKSDAFFRQAIGT